MYFYNLFQLVESSCLFLFVSVEVNMMLYSRGLSSIGYPFPLSTNAKIRRLVVMSATQ
jgi:hypothetical protein